MYEQVNIDKVRYY